MTQITPDTSKGQLVPFVFGQDAVAASQTDVQLPVVAGEATQVIDGYPMAFPYEVVGISAALSAAATAGSLAIGASLGGTEDADSVLTVTTQTNHYKRIPRGKMRGAAGTRLGAEITTTGAWDGTTADLVVVIWAIVYLTGV
jgi:hypothetical protein